MQNKITPKIKVAGLMIPGFTEDYKELEQSLLIHGRSPGTVRNYGTKLAEISLHFQKRLCQIKEAEVHQYLANLLSTAKSTSQSEFKHMVYGLRYYYKMIGKELNIKVPVIRKNRTLPKVMSKETCRELFDNTKNLKHRIILKFIYACGLRVSEAANLKWNDIDLDRMMIHIKQSKGKKDRYVPLSANLLPELNELYKYGIHCSYVFFGANPTNKMRRSGIRFIMDQAVKRIGLAQTGICLHTLRHSYATHLLEDGLDPYTIKELLGHSRIETTLVYLHVTDRQYKGKSSPLDTLTEQPTHDDQQRLKDALGSLIQSKLQRDRYEQTQFRLFAE